MFIMIIDTHNRNLVDYLSIYNRKKYIKSISLPVNSSTIDHLISIYNDH